MNPFASNVFGAWAFSSNGFTGSAVAIAQGVPSVARAGGGRLREIIFRPVDFCAPADITCILPEANKVFKRKGSHPLEILPKKKVAEERFDDKAEIARLREKVKELELRLKEQSQVKPEPDDTLTKDIEKLKREVASLHALLEKEKAKPPKVILMADPSHQEVLHAKLPEVDFIKAIPKLSKATALFASSYLLPAGLSRSVMQAESIGILIDGLLDAILPHPSNRNPIT